jgi:tellurite resistance protein TerC
MWRSSLRGARLIGVAIVGVGLLVIGLALLVLPGPGLLFLFLGLALLATEFAWARLWHRRLRVSTRRAGRKARARWRRPPPA